VAVESWVNRGAQISTGLRNLLKFSGYQVPSPRKTAAAKPAAEAKPAATKAKPVAKGTYRAPTRRALRKHAAKLKGVRTSALAAESAAKAAAAPAGAPAAPAAEAPKA
jgi:DNA-binding protein HU-beta